MSVIHRAMRNLRCLPQQLMKRVLRLLFQLQRQRRRWAQSGFVFPTTVLLLLVVALTASALTYRAYSRSTQAILERQQQVITNATTPAIDRAKAKLDYLLTQDTRSPRKVPTSDQMALMLQATEGNPGLEIVPELDDIYSLPDEFRLDIDGDTTNVDNAWYFTTDLNNDGIVADDEVVAYSILIDDNNDGIDLNDDVSDAKAAALVTRNGPISTSEVSPNCDAAGAEAGQRSAEGWQITSGSTIEKNFQVNAFVANLNDVSRTASTLEFQQVRSAARSNKWGAWFRYDLTVYPGPEFNWNGAMHTQGSLVPSENFKAYLISSTSSCLYDDSASEITLGALDSDTGFEGQLVYGHVNGAVDDRPNIHVPNGTAVKPFERELQNNNDSINGNAAPLTDAILQDPVEVYLNDARKHVDETTWNSGGINGLFGGRIRNIGPAELRSITLDDAFRADNRWGPKKVYDAEDSVSGQIPGGTSIGTNIGSISKLTNASGGLDGYWERQAINLGTRIIVGERLEIGDANGWNSNPSGDAADAYDALYPPNAIAANNVVGSNGTFGYAEQKQRKALRDNLAAVQGMVVYRYDFSSGTVPQACIAVTAHPGTLQSRANSRTFRKRTDNGGADVMTDFLTGNGTNGWEFEPVTSGMDTPLANLAKFAGDPDGGAPSFEPVQDSFVHPYPYMSMWGDYSTLRRVQDEGNGSPADQTYEDSAACTLGLLAYNLSALKDEYDNAITPAQWQALATELTTVGAPSLATEAYGAWQNALTTASYKPLVEAGYRYWEVERDRAYGFATGVGLPGVATATWGTYDPNNAAYTTSAGVDVYAVSTSYDVTCDPNLFADATYGIADEDDALSLALAICPKKTAVRYPALYYLFPAADHDQDGGEITLSGMYGGVTVASLTITVDQPTTEPYIAQTVTAYSKNENFAAVDYTSVAATPRTPGGTWTFGNKGTASANAAFTTTWGTDGSDASLPENDPFRVVVNNADGTFSSAFTVRAIDKGVYNGRENIATRLLDLDVGALATADWIPGKDASDIEHNGLVYAYREDAVREDEVVRPINSGATDAACNSFAVLKAYDSTKSECYMTITADALTSKDPPLSANNISLKPIDYAPDPDRRPYGFRLRNGSTLNRGIEEQSGISFITDNSVVIQGDFNLHNDSGSNLEEEFGDTQIFTLDPESPDFFDDFYERATLNLANFANSAQDSWRPAEVLADAIYIHSDGFIDGFVEAAYVHNAAGAPNDTFAYVDGTRGSGTLSYQNRNPFGDDDAGDKLLRDIAAILREGRGDVEAPIYFDRNGVIYNTATPAGRLVQDDIETGGTYYYWGFGNLTANSNQNFNQVRKEYLPLASGETTVNALLISGIVPPRLGQPYGGLHNFPRLAEFWNKPAGGKEDLNIAGGFFQLFFSTSATAPFDQDAWEADQTSSTAVGTAPYYNAPNRVWGYDVALQYSPQSPIASRFTSVGDPRSEFYRELPVDDPYINMLRCAEYAGPSGNVQIDPNASCS